MDETGEKFLKMVENTVGKGEIARYGQFLLFPVFSNDIYSRRVETRVCLGNDLGNHFLLYLKTQTDCHGGLVVRACCAS